MPSALVEGNTSLIISPHRLSLMTMSCCFLIFLSDEIVKPLGIYLYKKYKHNNTNLFLYFKLYIKSVIKECNWRVRKALQKWYNSNSLKTNNKFPTKQMYLFSFQSWSHARWQSRIIANAWFVDIVLCPVSDLLLVADSNSVVFVTFWTNAGWKIQFKSFVIL